MAEVVEKSPQAFLYGHAEKSEDDTPEVVSCILKHISSTPFTFTGRADCELTPINKIKSKCNIFEAWRSQDLIQRADSQYLESPMQYRSFFLAECEDIARQLQSKEPEESNTSKRKIEELDISTIEAEPPPFYCTPKSTLDDAEYSAKRRRLDLSEYSDKEKWNHNGQYYESPIPIYLLSKSKESLPVPWMGKDRSKPNEVHAPLLRDALDTKQAFPEFLTQNARKDLPLISIKELGSEPINKCTVLDGEDIQLKNSCYFAYRTQESLLETPPIKTYCAAKCELISTCITSKHTGKPNEDMVGKDRHLFPYVRTPLKVKIAFELTQTFSPLDKRNIKEGPSILGVTLLDLDKMTMEEHGGTCHKDKSVSNDGVLDVLQNKLLNTTVSIEKQEQQNSSKKTADSNTQFSEKSQILNKPFERNANPMKVNQNLKRSELLNNTVTLTDQLKINNSPLKKLSIISNKLQPLNSFTVNNIRPNNIPIMPPRISRNATKNAMDIRVVTTEAMKKNAAAHDTVLIDNGMTVSNRTQNAVSASSTEVSVDITQDIVPIKNKIASNNSAEGNKHRTWATDKITLNTTHDIMLKPGVLTVSNSFQENISGFSNVPTSNTVQGTQSTCSAIGAANATQDIISKPCKVSKSNANQGAASAHVGTNVLNITQDIITSHNFFHQPGLMFGKDIGRTKPSLLSKLKFARNKEAVRHKRPKELGSNGYTVAGRNILLKNGVYASSSEEIMNDTKPVEHCRMIPEPDIAQDESIFYDGSIPLITSTPMPGLCNHRFIKKSFECTKKDDTKLPSSAMGVQKRILTDNRENTQILISNGLQGRTTSDCSLVPRFSKKSILPKSVKVFRKPQPPSNTLAICSQAPVTTPKLETLPEKQVSIQKEIVVASKKSSQNIPETSQVGTGDASQCQTTTNSSMTPSIKTAKTSGIAVSKLPLGSSVARPPCRLLPPSSGKFSFGASSSSTALQKAAFGFRISERPAASTGIPIRNHGLVSKAVGRGVE